MIVDPWGEIVAAQMSEREAVVTERIRLDAVSSARELIPCRRRPDVYGDFARLKAWTSLSGGFS